MNNVLNISYVNTLVKIEKIIFSHIASQPTITIEINTFNLGSACYEV